MASRRKTPTAEQALTMLELLKTLPKQSGGEEYQPRKSTLFRRELQDRPPQSGSAYTRRSSQVWRWRIIPEHPLAVIPDQARGSFFGERNLLANKVRPVLADVLPSGQNRISRVNIVLQAIRLVSALVIS